MTQAGFDSRDHRAKKGVALVCNAFFIDVGSL